MKTEAKTEGDKPALAGAHGSVPSRRYICQKCGHKGRRTKARNDGQCNNCGFKPALRAVGAVDWPYEIIKTHRAFRVQRTSRQQAVHLFIAAVDQHIEAARVWLHGSRRNRKSKIEHHLKSAKTWVERTRAVNAPNNEVRHGGPDAK